MRAALIAAASLAAITISAAPAAAQSWGAAPAALSGNVSVQVHRNGGGGQGWDWNRDRRSRHPGFASGYVIADREYQGDSAWKSDSFNDWWHDQPHRAFPRWVSDNRNCDRRWWSGGVWRC